MLNVISFVLRKRKRFQFPYFTGNQVFSYIYLEGTKAPAGYNQLTGPVEISINNLGTEALLSIPVSVSNQAGTLLPSTGGMGTTVFYVLGTVLVLGAVVLLVTKKRMSNANR